MTFKLKPSALRSLLVAAFLLHGNVALSADAGGLTGKWFNYPGRVDPLPITVPPPAPIPDPKLKPEYLEAWQRERAELAAAEASGAPIATGYTECLPDGMPAMMQAMFPMEVLETPGQVTIIQEAYNQVRRIYLDQELLPVEEAEPLFWGHAVGQWEGDTLVVNTIGIKDYVRFMQVPHSEQMRIEERIRLVSDDMMENKVKVTDPVYLDEPWEWTWMYARRPDYRLHEYVCENNREYRDPQTGTARLRLFGE